MEQYYTVSVKVADVNILFQSDMEIDICHLRSLFKYHLTDHITENEPKHIVNIVSTTKRIIPKDARLVWKGYYHAVVHRRDHKNDVRKYVSPDGAYLYFEEKTGECIVIEENSGKTTCFLRVKHNILTSANTRSNIETILMLLIHVIMPYHCRYTIHASAVVWKERAIVFTGRSGQGKSTISTDLAAKGAGFLGDDIIFLYMKNGQLRIASLLFDAKLFESSKKDKDFVDILERYHCQKIDSAPLQAIAEVKQTRTGMSYLEKGANNDRLLDEILIAANNIALHHDHDNWLSLCTKILQDYHLDTFHFGDRTLLDVNILNQFFEQE